MGVMNRVKTRLSVGELTPANYKNIKSKVEWFKKKNVDGTLTEKLRPRLDEAEELWQQMQALKLEGASGASSASSASAAKAAASAAKAATKEATKTPAKKTPKAVAFANRHATGASSSASSSAASAASKPPVKGVLSKKKKQRPAEGGIIEREIEDMEAQNAENAENAPMTNLNYIRIASEKKLPLPEFYDPYTGKKFLPEESPMQPIERAYKELRNLRKTVYANAKRMKNAGSSRKTRKVRKA